MKRLAYSKCGFAAGLFGCVIGLAFPTGVSGTPTAVAPNFPYLDRSGYHEVLTGKWYLRHLPPW